MAKKKKTRQQKIIADLRRQVYASQSESNLVIEKKVEKQEQSPSSFRLPTVTAIEKKQSFATAINTSFLVKDLQKTAILTASIVAVQLILLFILKSHIFVLNGLIY